MRYVTARYQLYVDELTYRIYLSDSIHYAVEMKQLTGRYAEIVLPQKLDERTGDEIALELIQELGLKV